MRCSSISSSLLGMPSEAGVSRRGLRSLCSGPQSLSTMACASSNPIAGLAQTAGDVAPRAIAAHVRWQSRNMFAWGIMVSSSDRVADGGWRMTRTLAEATWRGDTRPTAAEKMPRQMSWRGGGGQRLSGRGRSCSWLRWSCWRTRCYRSRQRPGCHGRAPLTGHRHAPSPDR